MPSQIKVDEIKNVAGQYKIKTDTFEGQTTAGSITVQGENTNTTNLQQGLNKAWSNILYTSSAPGIQDSFNASSVADTDTGTYTVTLSNNMVNDDYVCVSNQQDFAVEHQSPSLSTTTYAIRLVADATGARADIGDGTNSFTIIAGDLA